MVSSVLTSLGLSENMLVKALLSICHILDRASIAVYLENPITNYFQVWSCLAHVKLPNQHTPKVPCQVSDCTFIGFSTTKAYRFLNLEIVSPYTIEESIHTNSSNYLS